MQHVRTIKEPKQSIPTFAETVALLMKVTSSFLLHPASLTKRVLSLKTSMPNLTWMSKYRTTPTSFSL